MNITNLEVTQATIDMFFCIVCTIMVVAIRTNNPKKSSMKSFVRLFLIAALLFLGETLAYIFRGNLGTFNVAVTRAANLIVFAMNVAMANTYVRYVCAIFTDRGIEVGDRYIRIANILSYVSMLILAINMVYPWMYYFDRANYYHRNDMWYIYTVLTLVVIFLGAGVAAKYYKEIEIRSFISVMLFSFIPIIATLAQVFIYGISITNLGLGIGALIMFAAYMYDWMHESEEDLERTKNHRFDVIVLFVIMLLSMSASIIACGSVIQRVARDNSKMQSETIARMVSAKIENEFIKPITVSQTISQDLNVRSNIAGTSRKEAEAVKDEMTEYLISVGDEFGYKMAFVVSDVTRAYYTYNGISKYLDVDNDSHDIWYKEYIESGKNYIVNVDTDEDNNWSLSVFVNYGILDGNGKILGACGVGVDMNDLKKLIRDFEKEYDIEVDLVNHDGLIQIDSDGRVIETEYLDNSYFDNVDEKDFYYQISDGQCYMTKYIEELDWYLVVKDNNPVKLDANRIILPIVLIFMAGVVIMSITFAVISIRERKASDAYVRRYEASIKDELTGLYNRRGYEVDCGVIKKEGTLSRHSIIMMDLNGLKFANDNLGHEAGDELIIGAAKCMNNAFSGLGSVYRVGGDEFVALLDGSKGQVEASVETFDYLTSNFKGRLISELTVSKGVVVCAEHPELTFEEMKDLADKLMYADKDEYYRRTGRERRKG